MHLLFYAFYPILWDFILLLQATNVMGDRCEFDSSDMERVRYGSCVYYACYPYYLQLVNATGGRFFRDPFSQFQPFAQCEINSAKQVRAP